jgi:hypothetical protein
VVYAPLPQPPSPVPEGSEKGLSPRALPTDSGRQNTGLFEATPKELGELKEKLTEARTCCQS